MKKCPKCSRLVSNDQWLCECGYEFSGTEPIAKDSPTEAAAREEKARLSPFTRAMTSIAVTALTVGVTLLTISNGRASGLVVAGFLALAVSALCFSWRAFHSASSNPGLLLLGVALVLACFACVGLSFLGACAMSLKM